MQKYEEEMEKELDQEKASLPRELQRQQLVQTLIEMAYQMKENMKDRTFHLKLIQIVVQYLEERQRDIAKPGIKPDKTGIFFSSILITIRAFARSIEEEDFLVSEFLEKITVVGLYPFYRALTEKGMA